MRNRRIFDRSDEKISLSEETPWQTQKKASISSDAKIERTNGMGDTLQILIAMVIYMAAVIILGVTFARRANASSDAYFLGGRSLGPWVTAMSAEASDMSGWLLMGLPGVAYWCGIADAAWTAIGLAAGTYVNWLIVSKRLRRYSEKAGNAITLPEYFYKPGFMPPSMGRLS